MGEVQKYLLCALTVIVGIRVAHGYDIRTNYRKINILDNKLEYVISRLEYVEDDLKVEKKRSIELENQLNALKDINKVTLLDKTDSDLPGHESVEDQQQAIDKLSSSIEQRVFQAINDEKKVRKQFQNQMHTAFKTEKESMEIKFTSLNKTLSAVIDKKLQTIEDKVLESDTALINSIADIVDIKSNVRQHEEAITIQRVRSDKLKTTLSIHGAILYSLNDSLVDVRASVEKQLDNSHRFIACLHGGKHTEDGLCECSLPYYGTRCEQVDGAWSSWSLWQPCSTSCGTGLQEKTRSCDNPSPSNQGQYCKGSETERQTCTLKECPVHGRWSDWSGFGECSVSCGGGRQRRFKTCSDPAPSNDGQPCVGSSDDTEPCGRVECPVHGVWSDWSRWSACSLSCDQGTKQRLRTCIQEQHGGRSCRGDSVQVDVCQVKPCYSCFNGGKNSEDGQCECVLPYYGTKCEKAYEDCYDIHKQTDKPSGIYEVQLRGMKETIEVKCDMTTDGGGWTVFQYRYDGSVEFYKNFRDHETGFGSLTGEFWIGLRYIQAIASLAPTMLRIDLEAADGDRAFQTFEYFSLSEGPDYQLNFGKSLGTAGDSNGLSRDKGQSFSTHDRDRDGRGYNCAELRHGAWWYRDCGRVNLNGYYTTPGTTSDIGGSQCAMFYYNFKSIYSLKTSKMMIRRN